MKWYKVTEQSLIYVNIIEQTANGKYTCHAIDTYYPRKWAYHKSTWNLNKKLEVTDPKEINRLDQFLTMKLI